MIFALKPANKELDSSLRWNDELKRRLRQDAQKFAKHFGAGRANAAAFALRKTWRGYAASVFAECGRKPNAEKLQKALLQDASTRRA
jgi:hypothetical protein